MKKFLDFGNYYVRDFIDSDLDLIYKLRSDVLVQKYHPNGVFNYQKIEQYFKELKQHYQKYNFSYLPVFRSVDNKFVGICGLMFFDPKKENFMEGIIEVGYAIMPEFWGMGIATLISQGFIRWGFKNLPISRIIAVCNPLNIGSIKVIEKLGGKYIKTVINPRIGDQVEMYEILN